FLPFSLVHRKSRHVTSWQHQQPPNMSSAQKGTTYSVTLPDSPPPPADLPSYSRSMRQHTKRQMDAASLSSRRRSQNPSDAPRARHKTAGAAPRCQGGSSPRPAGGGGGTSHKQGGAPPPPPPLLADDDWAASPDTPCGRQPLRKTSLSHHEKQKNTPHAPRLS